VAKPELGTKRVCPETGRKFYDLNKDPIVSPYTGKEYPISYFEETAQNAVIEKEEEEEVAEVEADSADVEIVSLEEADEDTSSTGKSDDLPDIDDGALAQLGERLHGMQEVSGSIPLGSTTNRLITTPCKTGRLGPPKSLPEAMPFTGNEVFFPQTCICGNEVF
jgi:uncharacterized protein (TIGR02300 family)